MRVTLGLFAPGDPSGCRTTSDSVRMSLFAAGGAGHGDTSLQHWRSDWTTRLPNLPACDLAYSRVRCCFRWPDGIDVLANGSFEEGQFRPNKSGGIMSLPVDSTTMPGWTVVGDRKVADQDVAWAPNSNAFVSNGTTDKQFFLDLTGANDKQSSDGASVE